MLRISCRPGGKDIRLASGAAAAAAASSPIQAAAAASGGGNVSSELASLPSTRESSAAPMSPPNLSRSSERGIARTDLGIFMSWTVISARMLAAVRHSLLAATRADWEDVPAEVRAKLKVHFVKLISEALQLALAAK